MNSDVLMVCKMAGSGGSVDKLTHCGSPVWSCDVLFTQLAPACALSDVYSPVVGPLCSGAFLIFSVKCDFSFFLHSQSTSHCVILKLSKNHLWEPNPHSYATQWRTCQASRVVARTPQAAFVEGASVITSGTWRTWGLDTCSDVAGSWVYLELNSMNLNSAVKQGRSILLRAVDLEIPFLFFFMGLVHEDTF